MSTSNRARSFRIAFSRHLAPQSNVGNAFLVASHDDCSSLGDGAAILAASATDAARSSLRVQNLACAPCADGNAEPAKHSHHLVVGGANVLLARTRNSTQ